MSITNRVNVFLERARQLSSTSPIKSPYVSKSPLKSHEERLLQNDSTIRQERKISHLSKINSVPNNGNNLESMVEDFLKSRYTAHKKRENHNEKELKVITELKNTLDLEIEKSKINTNNQSLEKTYNEKADKVLMIVKHEAMNMDKKLKTLQEENIKLKQMLSEKNIEIVDAKINRKRLTVQEILQMFSSRFNGELELPEEFSTSTAILRNNIKGIMQKYEKYIKNIDNNDIYHVTTLMCFKILEIQDIHTEEYAKYSKILSQQQDVARIIQEKLKNSQENHRKIKQALGEKNAKVSISSCNKADLKSDNANYQNKEEHKEKIQFSAEIINEDEIFMTTSESVEKDQDFLQSSSKLSLNASGILYNIYEEILDDAESL